MNTTVHGQDSGQGKVALVTGSSRGIGAATAELLAATGATVVVNYRDKVKRAEQVVEKLAQAGGGGLAVKADLTSAESVAEMFATVSAEFGRLDLLVLNASGGMEKNMGEDYALKLNRDAQVNVLKQALPLMSEGARVVFVTSHQAHFIHTMPTLPEYLPVALSKRAGEDALRATLPELTRRGIEFVVVSGDMIVGTVTATLLNRINPGVLDARTDEVGKLYTVEEFAAEVAAAAVDPIPEDNTRYVGDISTFAAQ